jgi:hypothetical protein
LTSASTTDDVFINCPFDDDFRPIFRAITFAVFFCGFRLRSALEIEDGSYARLEKIMDIVGECRFGIHDLSRTEPDPINQLPRFNMPLELGIFLGAKRFGDEGQRRKYALVIDTERYRYQKFISDIGGMDIKAHDGMPEKVTGIIRDWLANVSHRRMASAPIVISAYHRFTADFPQKAMELEFDPNHVPYVDFQYILADWLTQNRG